MNSKNKLIYLVRNVLGEDEPTGFYTYVKHSNETYKVPNYLFKDAPAEYPEIRISPFIRDVEEVVPQRKRGCNFYGKLHYYTATFQIDIYATTIPMVNDIYEAVYRRIDLFDQYDTVVYGYNKSFRQIDDTLYFSNLYNSENFNIFRILIKNNIIHEADSIYRLNNNTYIIDEDGLYIRTTLPIKDVQIVHIINGLKFNNSMKTSYDEHIINMGISDVKMLSELEKNSVERMSFNLNILYHMLRKRKFGPILEDVNISSDINGSQKRYKNKKNCKTSHH